MIGWSDSVGDAVGVGDGEGAEGGFPAVHGRALDEPAGRLAFVARLAGFLGSLPGPLVLDVTDREPQQLDYGIVVGEVASVLDDLAELVVSTAILMSSLVAMGGPRWWPSKVLAVRSWCHLRWCGG